ncbi:hypothetical protein SLA2020_254980 [Shorea laevis]
MKDIRENPRSKTIAFIYIIVFISTQIHSKDYGHLSHVVLLSVSTRFPTPAEGTVKAVDLKNITTGKDDKGPKIGYPIEELAESSTFLEVAYLLMYGNLASESQLADWEFAVSQHSAVPQGILDIIQSMPHDAHPMGVLVSAMSALSIFHPDANPAFKGQDIYGSKQVIDKQIARILGKGPTIAAAAYLRMGGRPPVLPSSNPSYAENFLYMLDSMRLLA